MSKFYFTSVVSLMLGVSSLFSACTQDDDVSNSKEKDEIEERYNSLMSRPTISLLGINQNSARSTSEWCVPTITQEDLDYLSSLNQEDYLIELEKSQNLLLNFSQEEVDEIVVNHYNTLLNSMGGTEGLSNLMDFGIAYLHQQGGAQNLQKVIPNGLNEIEAKYFVAMAVYVDRIARPMGSIMNDSIDPDCLSRQIGNCKWDAEMKLLLAGCEFGLDTLIEIMSGGIDTEGYFVEDAYTLANLEQIYYDYEVCMGRLH